MLCRLPATTAATANVPRTLASNSRTSICSTSSITPATATSIAGILGRRGLAALDSMSHLTTIAALDPGVVTWLGAVLGEMTNLIAVAALGLVWVLRLVTVLGDVPSGIAIAAGSRGDIGTILGEVTSFHALAALDTLSRTRFGTFLGVVALLLAVLARVRVESLLGAVARTMTNPLAVDTGYLWLVILALWLLLFTVLTNVAKLTTVAAKGNTAVLDKASRGETLHILLGRFGPAL